MKQEVIEQMQKAFAAVFAEIKEHGYDEQLSEMLFILRHARTCDTDPARTEFKVGVSTYKLVETSRGDWRIDIWGHGNKGQECIIATIIYDGEDYRLTDEMERSTTRYIDLLSDNLARLSLIFKYF